MPFTPGRSVMCRDQAAAESSTFCSKPASVVESSSMIALKRAFWSGRQVHAGQAEVADRQLEQAPGALAPGVLRPLAEALVSSYSRWLWPSSVA